MNKIVFIFGILFPLIISAQQEYTKEQIKEITDSIMTEGNLLYHYERAAWVSSDLASIDKTVSKQFSSYLVYQDEDSIKAIIITKKNEVAATYTYFEDFTKEYKSCTTLRQMTSNEKSLLTARDAILENITGGNDPLSCPAGYNLNMILIPYEQGYKYYILTGTSKNGVIPFGNDYVFFAGNDYTIISWRKFHSGLIPVEQPENGYTLRNSVHSHLKKEPFITATDICTFKLYAGYVNLQSFQVYSPALSLYFRYSFDSDSIETSEKTFD